MSAASIAKCEVKNLVTGTVTTLEKFWEEKNCAIIFFRRWGCQYCRVYAKELSGVIPILKKHNIDMVGIGLEEFGAQDFIEGKYFDGDLYVDNNNKQIYKTMGFKRFNWFTIFPSLLWSDSRAAYSKSKEQKVTGNLAGDGFQTGGALMVSSGGDVLLEFKQNGPGHHLTNEEILEAFNLKDEIHNLPKRNPNEPKRNPNEPKPECANASTK